MHYQRNVNVESELVERKFLESGQWFSLKV